MERTPFTDTPAFWVVLLVLGVPGLYALVLSLLQKTTRPGQRQESSGNWEARKALLQEEMALEEKVRDERKALEEKRAERVAETEEKVREEQAPAQTPEKVAEYLGTVGKKVRK